MRLRFFWNWLKAEYRWRVLGKRYEVHLTDLAQSQINALPEDAQTEIMKTLDRLSRNPYTGDRFAEMEDEK